MARRERDSELMTGEEKNTNNDMNKKMLRRQILMQRDALTLQERKRASVMLTERICGHQWFYLADTVLGFVSYGSEIDTTEILQEALRKGKKVYVPRIEGDEMVFYRISSLEALVEGYKGIREPLGDSEIFAYNTECVEKIFMLMPGAVFDRQRNRIGYGKGFYDRYLADKQELKLRTVAVGYQCQLVESIPANEWDIKPYQVICV